MARDHAEITLTMWGDDDWRRLTPNAQHLYLTLLTSPSLTFCGVADWRPARISKLAHGWTAEAVQEAADELTERLYLVIDEDSEEALIRSFIRNDGLMKKPNVAIAMATAYAGVASARLRGVIVHELRRLHDEQPDLKGWASEKVRDVLTRDSVNPSVNPSGNPSPNPSGDRLPFPSDDRSESPSVNPCPTPAPAPTPTPAPSSNEERTTTAPRKRGRRIPDDFAVTDEMRQWAQANGFGHLNLDRITEEFRDYWAAESGQKAVKLDWVKTWRNRLRAIGDRTPQQQLALVRNERPLSGEEITNVLGPDHWRCPPPPAGLTADEEWEWRRVQQVEHIQQRQQQARARLGLGA